MRSKTPVRREEKENNGKHACVGFSRIENGTHIEEEARGCYYYQSLFTGGFSSRRSSIFIYSTLSLLSNFVFPGGISSETLFLSSTNCKQFLLSDVKGKLKSSRN